MDNTSLNAALRAAVPEDIWLLYEWANDPLVRANSFRSEPISRRTHRAWFERMMADRSVRQYIYLVGEEPVGQIRLTLSEDGRSAEIGYSIAAPQRGQGHGKRMLALLEEEVRRELPSVERLFGRVKPGNAASAGAFLGAGYSTECLVFGKTVNSHEPVRSYPEETA